MASHRIGARVAGLSPAQLCAIIEAQAGASDAALRVAEEHAARLVEQPEWVLSEVLLSPDLAPHILAQLPTKEHAVKGTCRAWRRGWKETLKKRERPRLLVIGGRSGQGQGIWCRLPRRNHKPAYSWGRPAYSWRTASAPGRPGPPAARGMAAIGALIACAAAATGLAPSLHLASLGMPRAATSGVPPAASRLPGGSSSLEET